MNSTKSQTIEGLQKFTSEWLVGPDYEKAIDERNAKLEKKKGSLEKIQYFLKTKSAKKHEQDRNKKSVRYTNFLKEEYSLLKEIQEKTINPKLSKRELKGLETKLLSFDRKHKKLYGDHNRHPIFICQFQFPEFAKKSLEPYFKISHKKLHSFYSDEFRALRDDAVRYKDLSEKLLKKMGEVYKFNLEKELKGDRELGGISPGIGLAWPVTKECEIRISQLGESLGWTEEKTYKFLGMNYKEIRENSAILGEQMISEVESIIEDYDND